MDIRNKMQNDTKTEIANSIEQDKYAALIDQLSIDTLEALKSGETNVDIAGLMKAIEAYSSFPNYITKTNYY